MPVSTLRPSDDDPYRIIPLTPNWSSPVRESFEYRTDIITSWDGKEQRRAVREFPRKGIEFVADIWDRRKLLLDWYMSSWQAKLSILVDPIRSSVLSSDLNDTPPSQTAGLARPLLGVGNGDTVILSREDGEMETRVVLDIGPVGINLGDVSGTKFPKGTKIYGTHLGYLQDQPRTTRPTTRVTTLPVIFDVEPGTFSPVPSAGTTYAGWREAMMGRPDWSGGIGVDHLWPRNTVDYGFGKIEHFVPYKFPSRITRFDFVESSREGAIAARDFFLRHLGRQREFVVPTWENDIPYQFIAAGSNSILIEGEAFARIYADTTVFKRIVLRMADGTFHHRSVDFIEYLPDTDTSVLWTNESLPFESMTPATMLGISWGTVSRFATDRMEFDWLTDRVVRFSMTFQALENFDL